MPYRSEKCSWLSLWWFPPRFTLVFGHWTLGVVPDTILKCFHLGNPMSLGDLLGFLLRGNAIISFEACTSLAILFPSSFPRHVSLLDLFSIIRVRFFSDGLLLLGCLLILKSKDWASDWNLWACGWHLISSESVLCRVIWLGCFLRKLQWGGQHLLVLALGWSDFRHKNPPILLMEN